MKSNSDKRFWFQIKVKGILIKILINSRLNRDLIKFKFIKKYQLPITKCKLYTVLNFNGIIIDIIKSYTKLLSLRIGCRFKRYLFNLIQGGVDNITLRIL